MEKKVGPSLAAAADIQLKYFGKEPTTKTLQEVKEEIMDDHDTLPILELAFILMLVEAWHRDLQKKPQLVLVGA